MPSKYGPLTQYLTGFDRNSVRLTFSRLEEILGFSLPPSANKYAAWWSNHDSHPQAVAWMAADWRQTNYSLPEKWVELTKD